MYEPTPVKVRGKRNAIAAEKWHYGKQRKKAASDSRSQSERASTVQSTDSEPTSSSQKKRKHRNRQLSRLEQLPTEILHDIFERSANVDLASASPQLAYQLASAHLHEEITDTVIRPVLDDKTEPTASDIAAVARLMNSRFFTWPFFYNWLHARYYTGRPSIPQWAEGSEVDFLVTELWIKTFTQRVPKLLLPQLLPPPKLLCPPFTVPKVEFLNFMLSIVREDQRPATTARYGTLVEAHLQHVVDAEASDILASLFKSKLTGFPDMELLRHAIINAGCHQGIVETLIRRMINHDCWGTAEFNFLDPQIWQWAEQARDGGNGKGTWVIEQMRKAGRVVQDTKRYGVPGVRVNQ